MRERHELRSHPERSAPDEIDRILGAGMVAHLGFEIGGQPFVIPMTYGFRSSDDPDRLGTLYIHGSTKGRAMKHLATGAAVCVTVTHLDQLVASKVALDHSMNYRSAVCFGRGRLIDDDTEKADVLEEMIARYFEGRTEGVDYAPPPAGHLKATALVAIDIEAGSGKVRRGPPNGPGDDDPAVPGTAFLVEVGDTRM